MSTNILNNLHIGTTLHGQSYNYVIQKVLGQGTFGITYLAKVKMQGALGSLDSNVKVAIKEFFMREINGREGTTVTSGSQSGLYADYRKKFAREAQNLAKLQHPHIIKVLESFEENNTIYYVMEYVDGGSLDDYIEKKGHIPEQEAMELTKQICSALSFMHKNKMLHLDLKPGNIMRKKDGTLVLIDFGLSKNYSSNGEPESSTTVGGGTPGYAPIEQSTHHDGHGFPVTMDVYALGATMYKMLTGVRAPEASEILNEGFPSYNLQSSRVSNNIIGVVKKAMNPLKKDRIQQISDLMKSLDHYKVSEITIFDIPSQDENNKLHKETQNKNGFFSYMHNEFSATILASYIIGLVLIMSMVWQWGDKWNYHVSWGVCSCLIVLFSTIIFPKPQRAQKHPVLWCCVMIPFAAMQVIQFGPWEWDWDLYYWEKWLWEAPIICLIYGLISIYSKNIPLILHRLFAIVSTFCALLMIFAW